MPIVASGAYRQDRRIYTLAGKNKFEIEAVVTAAGDFPDAAWFLIQIVDSENTAVDEFERVATIEDYTTYPATRDEALVQDLSYYRSLNVKITFDDPVTAVTAIDTLHDLINDQALVVSTSRAKFFPDLIAEEFGVPSEETTLAILTTGTDGQDDQIKWVATTPGPAGNRVAINITHSGLSSSLVVTTTEYPQTSPVNPAAIEVLIVVNIDLATNGGGVVTSKKRDVIAAVNTNATAGFIVRGAPVTSAAGGIVLDTGTVKRLAGGNRGASVSQALIDLYSTAKAATATQLLAIDSLKKDFLTASEKLESSQAIDKDMITATTAVNLLSTLLKSPVYTVADIAFSDLRIAATSGSNDTTAELAALELAYTQASGNSAAQTYIAAARTKGISTLSFLQSSLASTSQSYNDLHTAIPANTAIAIAASADLKAIQDANKAITTANRNALAAVTNALAVATDRLVILQETEAKALLNVKAVDSTFDSSTV